MILVTTAAGWLAVFLLAITITLPFVIRRGQPLPARLRPHFWLGYTIFLLGLFHALLATGTGLALHSDAFGLYLASAALMLTGFQLLLGILLREPRLRNRLRMRRRHLLVMVGIVILVLGHILLNRR